MSSFLSKKITRLSFILCVLVVCIHARNLSTYDINGLEGKILSGIQLFFSADITSFAVPTFFCLSGFLFFLSVKTFFDVMKKIKKRIFTLLIPFFIWTSFYTFIFLFVFNMPYISNVVIKEAVGDVTLKKIFQGIFLSKYSTHLWFLQSLIFFVTLTPMFYLIKKHKVVKMLFLFLFFVINIIDAFEISVSFFGIILKIIRTLRNSFYIDISNIFLFFLGSCLVDVPFFVNARKSNNLISVLFLVSLLVLSVVKFLIRDYFPLVEGIVGYPMMVCSWFAVDLVVTDKTYKIEKITFGIYCLHYVLQRIIKKVFILVLGNNFYSAAVNYLFNIFGVVLLIYLFSRIFYKLFPKVFKVVFGGRIF